MYYDFFSPEMDDKEHQKDVWHGAKNITRDIHKVWLPWSFLLFTNLQFTLFIFHSHLFYPQEIGTKKNCSLRMHGYHLFLVLFGEVWW